MKISEIILIVGAIILVLGIIFHLQGKEIVGPPSSFMYASSDWISYGFQIAVFGAIITAIGIVIKVLKKNQSNNI